MPGCLGEWIPAATSRAAASSSRTSCQRIMGAIVRQLAGWGAATAVPAQNARHLNVWASDCCSEADISTAFSKKDSYPHL